MFGQCALRTTLSKLTSELRWLFTFSQPFLGPFFLFLPNLSRPPYPSCVNGLVFSHPGLPLPLDSSTTASHGSNRAGLECCQCPFSYLALKIANRAAHGLFPFLLILSLECLFTAQEENGCYGAEALDVSKLQGKRLISLDGCEDTNTYVSSFRSDLVKCEKTLRWESASGAAVQVEVRDVSTNVYQGVPHQEQGNAVKLLARLLRAVSEAAATLRLFALEGGVAENIVPETAAVRFCYEGCSPEKLRALLQETFSQLTQELENPAQAGTLRITEVPAPDRAVTIAGQYEPCRSIVPSAQQLIPSRGGRDDLHLQPGCGEAGWGKRLGPPVHPLPVRQRRGGTASPLPYFGGLDGLLLLHRPPVRGLALPGRFPSAGLGHFNPVRHTPHLLKNGRKKSPDHLRA